MRDDAHLVAGQQVADIFEISAESYARGVCAIRWKAGRSSQITDGLSDARYPVFDKGGKVLYFAASTDLGLAVDVAGSVRISAPGFAEHVCAWF